MMSPFGCTDERERVQPIKHDAYMFNRKSLVVIRLQIFLSNKT